MDEDKKNITGESETGTKAGKHDAQPMPMVTFSTFVLSIASSALVHLGEVPDPESGEIKRSLEVAKHNVDILSMLKEKSIGNLDADELRLIDGVLYELRLKYVMADK